MQFFRPKSTRNTKLTAFTCTTYKGWAEYSFVVQRAYSSASRGASSSYSSSASDTDASWYCWYSRDQVVHVGLGLSELHLVHTLTSVPMQESLAPEHGGELVTDTLEELLDGGGVADEGGGHLETTRGNRAEGGLDVVGDPLDEVGRVLVLNIAHLVLDLLH